MPARQEQTPILRSKARYSRWLRGEEEPQEHSKARQLLTQQILRSVLSYEPDTGAFTWLVATGMRVKAGEAAGSQDKGYVRIKLQGQRYRAHRLVWLYVHGDWPVGEIDHINGDKTDNRICNLRVVDRSGNCQNARLPRVTNKSGLLGVRPCKGKWYAGICANGVRRHLGSFSTPEEAHQAYLDAKRQLHSGCTI